MTNLEHALRYASARGWHVFPVRGKIPLTDNGFKDATTNPAQITRWWARWPDAGIGVATGLKSGFWGLDIDPRNDGHISFAEYQQRYGELPDTLVSMTGSGGVHMLFAGTAPCTAGRVGVGIDTKGEGGYIVAPPSRHPDGGVYAWGNDLPIAVAPDCLMELVGMVRERRHVVRQHSDTPATPAVYEAARKALAELGPAIENGTGEPTTIRAAFIVANDYPLNREQAWTLLKEWNETCQPPWDLQDLEVKLDRGYQYASGDPVLENLVDDPDDLVDEPLPVDIRCTDMGNALRLRKRYGQDLRFIHDWGQWIGWERNRWALCQSGEQNRLAMDTAVSIQGELEDMSAELRKVSNDIQVLNISTPEGQSDPRLVYLKQQHDHLTESKKRLGKWLIDSQSQARLSSMTKVAESLDGLAKVSSALDSDPMLLGVRNGTLDLTNGHLRPANRKDLITKQAPVEFDTDVQCPLWTRFLQEIMLGDQELVTYLQRAVGYTLTAQVTEQCFFFLYGDGSNGKSVFLNVLLHVLGDYAKVGAKTLIEEDKTGSRHTTDVAALQGARAVILSETEEARGLPEASIKRLTGGEPIAARKLYQDDITFLPTWKLWIAGNHKPDIRGSDFGIWRRLHCIPFRHHVANPDKGLLDKLKAESAGILAWAVRGCLDWQTHGLVLPKAIADVLAEYKDEQDLIGQFVGQCMEPATTDVACSAVYTAYQGWCASNGYRYPLTAKKFKAALERKGMVYARTMSARVWCKLRLVT